MDTPAPSRHERRRLRTRQLLAQSTLDLILEKGYDAITIQDITERADVGRGTFYLHFKDKEEVVWTMFRESFEKLEQEAHRQIDRSDTAGRVLRPAEHLQSRSEQLRRLSADVWPPGVSDADGTCPGSPGRDGLA